ncbi:MAG TPA: LamG domain-containing protein, partial [Candidatus Nanoarchaeia archaeon]|nr:LamG domain-containing protein [Candidatus Nanoarchaeia archaeon]
SSGSVGIVGSSSSDGFPAGSAVSSDGSTYTPDFSSSAYLTQDYISYWDFNSITPSDTIQTVANARLDMPPGEVHGASLAEGISVAGLRFDGTDDYIEVADDPALRLGTQQTVSTWFKWEGGNADGWQRLVGKGSNDHQIYGLWIYPNSKKVRFQIINDGGTSCIVQETLTSFDMIWHHMAGTYDGSNVRLYLDGNELKSEPCTINPPVDTTPVRFGYISGTFKKFQGILDEVKIYNRPLTAVQITALFHEFDAEISAADEAVLDNYASKWTFENLLTNPATGKMSVQNEVDGAPFGIIEGASSADGISGKALSFDGTDDYVEIPDPGDGSPLDLSEDFTVSVWASFNDITNNQILVHKYGIYIIDVQDAKLRFGRGSPFSEVSLSAVRINEWVHLVGVKDGATTRLYLNGEEVGSSTDSYGEVDNSNNLFVGRRGNSGDRHFFNGLLDEVALYKQALTPEQVKALYDEERGEGWNKYDPSQAELNALVDFDDDTSYLKIISKELDNRLVPRINSLSEVVKADLDLNQQAYFFKSPLVKKSPVGYFQFAGVSYIVEVVEENQFKGEVTIGIRNIVLPTYLKTEKFAIDEDYNILNIKPKTIELNVDADAQPDLYLHLQGYWNIKKELGLLILLSPVMNFDLLSSGETTLHNLDAQKFFYNGQQHTIIFIEELIDVGEPGADNIISVDGKQYLNPGDDGSDISNPFIHYFDERKTTGVSINLKQSFGNEEIGTYLPLEITRYPPELDQIYQDFFTQTKTTSIQGTTFKICKLDIPDPYIVDVCKSNEDISEQREFGLEADQPTVRETFNNLLFHYPLPESDDVPKQVNVYHLHDVDKPVLVPGIFAVNLINSRSFALKVDDEGTDEYYLLSHPQANYLDFELMEVTALLHPDLPPPIGKGDKEEVIFNLPVERFSETAKDKFRQIRVERLFEEEQEDDARYRITVETKTDNVIDLDKELETSVETYGFVNVQGVGEFRLNPTDIATAKSHMDISLDGSPIQLQFGVPQVIDEVLVHYNTVKTIDNYFHSKQADIHTYYDLSSEKSHPLSDEDFNIPLMKGHEIALGVDGKYYLLGYNPSLLWTGTEFFDLTQMRLERIGVPQGSPTERIITNYDSLTSTAIYTLESGKKIKVKLDHFDTSNKQVRFSVESPDIITEIVTSFDLRKEFMVELPQPSVGVSKVLEVSGKKFFNCDNADTKLFQNSMLLCQGSQRPVELKVNTPNSGVFNGIATYRGIFGGKKVTFQKTYDLSSSVQLKWSELTGNFSKDQFPALKINGEYFDLDGGNTLGSLRLINISSGQSFPVLQYGFEEGAQQGMIAIGETVYGFKQSLQDFMVTLTIQKESFRMLTSAGFIVQGTEEFITSVGEDIYTIRAEDYGRFLVVLLEDEQGLFYRGVMFKDAHQDVLLPNGDIIVVSVSEKEGELLLQVQS